MKKYISNLLSDNPLCGISTYNDTLDLSNGALSRKIKKIIFDGYENWSVYSVGTQNTYFYVLNYPYAIQGNVICSHYTYAPIYNGNSDNGVMVTSNGSPRFRPYNQDTISLADFIEWVKTQYSNNTPLTLWYILDTAETSTITVPTGLTGTVNGYLTQTGTPTPTSPIYPTANTVTMWADYTPNIYNSGWTTASGQPEKYNGGWT